VSQSKRANLNRTDLSPLSGHQDDLRHMPWFRAGPGSPANKEAPCRTVRSAVARSPS